MQLCTEDSVHSSCLFPRRPVGLCFVVRGQANSIEGCKKKEVHVVYTRWQNLKKLPSYEVGQVRRSGQSSLSSCLRPQPRGAIAAASGCGAPRPPRRGQQFIHRDVVPRHLPRAGRRRDPD